MNRESMAVARDCRTANKGVGISSFLGGALPPQASEASLPVADEDVRQASCGGTLPAGDPRDHGELCCP